MVAATNTIDSTAQSKDVPSARASSDRRRGDVEVSDLAFEAVLSVTRALALDAERELGGAKSASQVFEANAPESERGQSGSVGKEIEGGAGRFDRTSVDARASASPSDAAAGGRDSDATQLRSARAESRDAAAVESRGEQASHRVRSAQPGGETQSKDEAQAPRGPDQASPTATLAASSASTVAPDASQSKSPAQQVARILGVQRMGATTSARAVVPTAAPVRSPSAPTDSSQSGRAMGKQESAPNESRANRSTTESPQSAFEKLVASIRLNGSAHTSARIRLDPPDLGRILVNVRVDGEEIRIQVRTENAEARQLLQSRASHLSDALSQQGIDVGQFDVTDDNVGGSRSDAADFVNAGQAGLHGRDSGRGDSHESAHSAYESDRAAIAMWDVESETWVVSETRLDVKV